MHQFKTLMRQDSYLFAFETQDKFVNEFLEFDEPLLNEAGKHVYLLIFRSPYTSFSIIVGKETPIVTKPMIMKIMRENDLNNFLLCNVEYLGAFESDTAFQTVALDID